MKNKCKNLILAALAMLLISGTALGLTYPGNATTPVVLTVNMQVQDTAFTVIPVDAETQMNFSAAQGRATVTPSGQTSTIPWANITNGASSGTQSFNATINDTTIPLQIATTSDFASPVTLTTSSQTVWTSVAPGANASLFARANFSGAATGNSTKLVNISTSS